MKQLLVPPVFTSTTIMKAEWLAPSAWYGHVPFAFWLIENFNPKIFVELGTHYGVSYCAFNQAIQKLELTTKSYAIDTWKGDEHAGFYGEEVYAELFAYHDEKYSSFSRLVRSTFDRAVSHFADKSIDLLHIDGLHTYEAVKHDYETWLPKLSDRAIVLFHDINVRERGFGVWKFWDELSQQYPHFSFLHSHGLGVLGVGNNLDETLKALFETNSNSELVFQIRESFAQLGMAVAESWERKNQQQEIFKLETELQHTQIKLEQAQQGWQDTQTKLEQAQQGWQDTQTKLEQAQQGWGEAQNIVMAMETSKFWKLRQIWFTFKQAIGLQVD